jgi:hypothetical protein
MKRIFISYSRQNEEFALELATALSRAGADVWIDVENIPAGMNWSNAIQEGLDTADAMLVVLSGSSMESRNVQDEWQYFMDSGAPVIPVRWEDCKVHFQLHRLQYIDFCENDFDTAFQNLLAELSRKGVSLSQNDTPADSVPSSPSRATVPHADPVSDTRTEPSVAAKQPSMLTILALLIAIVLYIQVVLFAAGNLVLLLATAFLVLVTIFFAIYTWRRQLSMRQVPYRQLVPYGLAVLAVIAVLTGGLFAVTTTPDDLPPQTATQDTLNSRSLTAYEYTVPSGIEDFPFYLEPGDDVRVDSPSEAVSSTLVLNGQYIDAAGDRWLRVRVNNRIYWALANRLDAKSDDFQNLAIVTRTVQTVDAYIADDDSDTLTVISTVPGGTETAILERVVFDGTRWYRIQPLDEAIAYDSVWINEIGFNLPQANLDTIPQADDA